MICKKRTVSFGILMCHFLFSASDYNVFKVQSTEIGKCEIVQIHRTCTAMASIKTTVVLSSFVAHLSAFALQAVAVSHFVYYNYVNFHRTRISAQEVTHAAHYTV